MLKRVVGSLLLSTLACGMLAAQNSGAKVAHTVRQGAVTPAQETPSTLTTIYTDFGPTTTDYYNDTTGYYVLGPDNSVGDPEQAIGLPFTPRADSHVTQLQAAIGYISGTSVVEIGLYSDASGTPGTLLASGRSTKIPDFGACCTVVTVTIASTAVTAGTQYWIVASSDNTHAPDFTGVWQASNLYNISGNESESGWFTFSANVPAGAAKGTVP
jgi:hypothetical protein